MCLIKGAFVGKEKRNFDIIKMHHTMIKKVYEIVLNLCRRLCLILFY